MKTVLLPKLPLVAIVVLIALPFTSYAAEDTYTCYVKNVPGNASLQVKAASASEAADKATQQGGSLKSAYNLTYLDVSCVKKG